jgi:predicted O-methyltransferase YrrM
MTKKEKIESILIGPRMKKNDPTNPGNRLYGLYKMIKKHFKSTFNIVEIGTFEGASSELFALTCKSVITIDPYDIQPDREAKYKQESKDDLINAESTAKKRLKKYKNITMVKKMSLDALNDFEDESLDAVYVDGDHARDAVKEDIEAWLPKVKKGGYICGHDYTDKIVGEVINDCIGEPDDIFEDASWIKKV